MAEMKIATPAELTQKGRIVFLLKDSVLYGGAASISKAFALITFPLLARHFTVAEYGILDYYLALTTLLAVFIVFGQDSAVARYVYEHEDTDQRRQLISQSLVFQLSGLALLLPVLWLSADWLTPLLIESPDAAQLFKIALLQLPFILLIIFSQGLLKWTFARTHFLAMTLGFSATHATLLVVAVKIYDVEIQGVLIVNLITSAVFGALGLFFVRNWLTRPKNFRHLRAMLPFAVPFGVICVASAFLPTLERTLTNDLLGSDDLGLYAAATKIAMLVGLLVSAFQTAWGPFSLSLFKQADASHTYNWVLKLFALGMCISTLVLTMLAQPLIHFLATDRYSNAATVVFPLAMGLTIQATSWITEVGIVISKRSYLNLYSYSAAIAATLAGIWFFAPVFGLLGVGLSVLLGHTIKALISSWLAQRAYPLPWHYVPVMLIMSATLIFGLGATWLGIQVGTVAKNIALIASLLAVLLMGWGLLLNKSERQRTISICTQRN